MSISFSRRHFLNAACVGAAAAAAWPSAASASHGHQTELTADQALAKLKDGNARFVAENAECVDKLSERRHEIAGGQTPFAVVVSCSDSRVPPELVFACGLGDLFVIRDAGNTVDTVGMGSLQYAVSHLGVPLVVVLGHERCGAVAAAMAVVQDNATFPGSINRVVEPIVPAVLQARAEPGDLAVTAVQANVRRTVTGLRGSSEPLLREPLQAGKLRIVGAYYKMEDGRVDWFMES